MLIRGEDKNNFSSMKNVLIDYIDQLSVLENYINSIGDFLTEQKYDQESEKQNEEAERYLNLLTQAKLFFDLENMATDEQKKEYKKNERYIRIKNNVTELMKSKSFQESLKGMKIDLPHDSSVKVLFDDPSLDIFFHNNYFSIIEKQQHRFDLLYGSSIVMLVINFELMITRLLHYKIDRYPGIINIDGRQLTLKEIQELGDMNEAKNYIIDNFITSKMRDTNKEWIKYIKKIYELNLINELTDLEDQINETYQRRNILVHNGGIINNLYLKNTNKSTTQNLKLGDRLSTNKEYILHRINSFKVYGIGLMYCCWMSIEKRNIDRCKFVEDYIYKMLEDENYKSARLLYKIVLNDRIAQDQKLKFKINYWQTFKWTDELEKVKNEINSTDLSAARPIYQLCKSLLIDDDEGAMAKLKEVVISKEYKVDYLLGWPIFNRIKTQSEFIECVNELKEHKTSN